jgi:hypothetical protein
MTGASPDPGFSLSYELQPGDLAEIEAASPGRRRRRGYIVSTVVMLALIAAAFTALTVGSSGVPRWVYPIDGVIWGAVAAWTRIAWRLGPKQLARRAFRGTPRLHGRHCEKIDSRGVIWIAPDGVQTFIPWSGLRRVRETEHAFMLEDNVGAVLSTLPKRGLQSPDLIPALREFLSCSVGGQPPAATPRLSSTVTPIPLISWAATRRSRAAPGGSGPGPPSAGRP